MTYGLFRNSISHFEAENGIDRGSNNSALTAMLFGEYFPNPAFYDHSVPDSYNVISSIALTAMLFVIFSLHSYSRLVMSMSLQNSSIARDISTIRAHMTWRAKPNACALASSPRYSTQMGQIAIITNTVHAESAVVHCSGACRWT